MNLENIIHMTQLEILIEFWPYWLAFVIFLVLFVYLCNKLF